MLKFEQHLGLLIGAIILCLLFALYIYYKDERFKNNSVYVKGCIVFLRFLSLCIIAILLFKPKWFLKTKQIEKPIIIFLQDASSSILNYSDSTFYKSKLPDIILDNNKKLSEKFDIYSYHFSENVSEGITNIFNGESTNLSNGFKYIIDGFHNRNVAAIIIASDGNYNKGINPYYQSSEISYPVFTLGIGDTILDPDLSLESIRHNEIAFYQNKFPISFDVSSNFKTDSKYKIQIKHQGKSIYSELVSLKVGIPLRKEIFIDATKSGIQYYEIVLDSFEGERNLENNKKTIAIEILNNQQKILILSSAPHPDIGALKHALKDGLNYEVKSALIHEFKEEIEPFNLILLHQIPDLTERNKSLLDKITSSESSLFFITGKLTNWTSFSDMQNLISISQNQEMQEVFPIINTDFTPFELNEKCKEFIESAPPLQSPFGEYILKNRKQSLFKQRIKGVETNKPLFLFNEQNERKIAVLLAEGVWKWRLYDYQKNESHENFNDLFQAVSQYLTLNKDKRKLRLQYPKIISEGENFQIEAQLYNDNYQLIKNAEINLILKDQNDKKYIYLLQAPISGESYKGAVKNLNNGEYSFQIESKYKNNELNQEGTFVVMKSTIEQQTKVANWSILKKISSKTGGLFIKSDDFKEYSKTILDHTENKEQIYFSKSLTDLIKQKYIFLVLLISLCLEWTIRKRLGTH